MRNSILLSALFFHTLAGAFLCFVADRVYGLWTGGFGLWPVVLPALAALAVLGILAALIMLAVILAVLPVVFLLLGVPKVLLEVRCF